MLNWDSYALWTLTALETYILKVFLGLESSIQMCIARIVLDFVEAVVGRSTLAKFTSIMDDSSHPKQLHTWAHILQPQNCKGALQT